MILNFKKQFKQQIIDGIKIHTIRLDEKERWKAGNKIHYASGAYKKGRVFNNQLPKSVGQTCISTQKIEFRWSTIVKSDLCAIFIDGIFLGSVTYKEYDGEYKIEMWNTIIVELAKFDGFSVGIQDHKHGLKLSKNAKIVDSFIRWPSWWKVNFKGKIIHWTNKTY